MEKNVAQEANKPDSEPPQGAEIAEGENNEEISGEGEQEGEEEEKEEEEEEEEEEVKEEQPGKKVKQRRCQRRKKVRQICLDFEDDYGVIEEEDEGFLGEEEDEDEEEEESDSDDVSLSSSVYSAISFEWENQIYEFEELCDPGNIETIYRRYYTEPNLTDEIGALRYLHLCKVLSVTPMIRFYQALYTSEVDLSRRQINGKTIRAMCGALEINTTVHKLILRYNRLNREDCYYIALMLRTNEAIILLDLTGCRIGPQGVEEFVEFLPKNEVLTDLNLSKCYIQNEGMQYLSKILAQNNSIQNLDLSYNKLGEEAAEALGYALKLNKSIKNLNLRYNNMFDPPGMTLNDSVIWLDLAWNAMSGPDTGSYIGSFLRRNMTILFLDLSDNRFEGPAIMEIKRGLSKSRSLETLKLSRNPMSPEDLDSVLSGAKGCSTLKTLDLEDLWVKKSFIKMLNKIRLERELEVNIGGIYSNYEVFGPDYPRVILRRAQFEAMKPKKAKLKKDFGHLIWTLGEEPMTEEQFMTAVKKFKAKINKELFPELIKQFMIPKAQLIDVVAMKRKYLSIFPDSTPPPPPKTKGGTKEVPQEPIEAAPPTHEQPAPVAQIFADSQDEEEYEDMAEDVGEHAAGVEENILYLPDEEEEEVGVEEIIAQAEPEEGEEE